MGHRILSEGLQQQQGCDRQGMYKEWMIMK